LEGRTLLSGTGSLTPIAAFDGANGSRPTAIVVDSDKNLFGVTSATTSGSSTTGPGNVFEIAAGTSTINVLATFPSGVAGNILIIDKSDNLFGTTVGGGANNTGFIFEVVHGTSTIKTLASFPAVPTAPTASASNQVLTDVDSEGNLFGIDANRNPFRLIQGATAITSLDSSLAAGASDGVTDLRLASDNTLLGTTQSGGTGGAGSIFAILPGTATLNTLASFDAATTGANPVGITFRKSTGDLVGFTAGGGANGGGTIFRLPVGGATISTIASFSSDTGTTPASRPFYDTDGDLLGLTKAGGANGAGTFFAVFNGAGGTITTIADATSADVIQPALSDFGDDAANQAQRDADGGGFFVMLGAAGSGTIYNGKLGNEGGGPMWSVSGVSGKVPASVVGGQKAAATVQVAITDTGDIPVSGNLAISLFVSPDGTLDGATQIGKTTTRKLALKGQQSRNVPIKITSFPDVPAGTYQIVASVIDSSNNTSTAAGPSLTIAPPFVQTVVSALTPQTTSVVRGKKASLSFTLTDSGNTPVAGTANLTIAASADASGAGAQPVATVPVKVKLKAGAAKTVKVKFTLPPGAPAGPAFLAVSLDVAALGDTNPANGNAIAATPITVS
jgi:uncharacterized repeat protein (TIGR03803 family)